MSSFDTIELNLRSPRTSADARPARVLSGTMTPCSIISSVNNESVLSSCLLQSPDVQAADEVILQRGYSSAAAAYNDAIDRATRDLLIFAHQDIYLPPGWLGTVEKAIEALAAKDRNWGVLGVWGRQRNGKAAGHLYWHPQGVGRISSDAFIEVESLDEVVLIFRKSSGLRFDECIPGFHMYGADICMECNRRGLRCYTISAFCIHNNIEYRMLPAAFWKAYWAMRKKWRAHLPVKTTCIEITNWCWPMIRWNFTRAINLITGRDKPAPKRAENPALLYRDLAESGQIHQKGIGGRRPVINSRLRAFAARLIVSKLSSFLFFVYCIDSRILRNCIRYQVAKLEGWESYSKTLRRIFREYYGVDIGMYTAGGCFDYGAIDRATTIGRYCSIARPVRVINHNHPMDFKSTHAFFSNPFFGYCGEQLAEYIPLSIGNDVWIGSSALILPNVRTIGDGAVIAAGAVVNKDVPPYAVVVGNPARVVRFRFPKEVIEKLLAERWWDRPIEELDINQFTRPYLTGQAPVEIQEAFS